MPLTNSNQCQCYGMWRRKNTVGLRTFRGFANCKGLVSSLLTSLMKQPTVSLPSLQKNFLLHSKYNWMEAILHYIRRGRCPLRRTVEKPGHLPLGRRTRVVVSFTFCSPDQSHLQLSFRYLSFQIDFCNPGTLESATGIQRDVIFVVGKSILIFACVKLYTSLKKLHKAQIWSGGVRLIRIMKVAKKAENLRNAFKILFY